jgi:hypothetical protein
MKPWTQLFGPRQIEPLVERHSWRIYSRCRNGHYADVPDVQGAQPTPCHQCGCQHFTEVVARSVSTYPRGAVRDWTGAVYSYEEHPGCDH